MTAGILPGDELLAIDGTRVKSPKDVDRMLRVPRDGRPFELLTARRGLIQRRTLAARPDGSVDIALRISAEDNPVRRAWLRRET